MNTVADWHTSDSCSRQQCTDCLGAVAHRLSQPLTALRGSLELAVRTKLSAPEARAALEQALELTDLVVQLVKPLRELADAATAGAPSTRLSLRDLAKETVEELRGLAEARGIKILVGTSLEATVCGPPDRLREVITRLLFLVIQRSPQQGEIWLALSLQQAEGWARLLITDQGAGPGEFDFEAAGTMSLGCLYAKAAKNHWMEWAVLSILVKSLGGTLRGMPGKPQGGWFLLQLPLANSQD